MESVIVSIKPEWLEKIIRGEKTIEVRKSAPKEVPFKCFIYETKGTTETPWVDEDGHLIFKGRGQVIGEFICDKVMFLTPLGLRGFEMREEILKLICLTNDDLNAYGGLKTLYGWHISDLKIYDKPKELREFRACDFKSMNGTDVCGNYDCKYYQDSGSYMIPPSCAKNGCRITRPPQSWQFVEELEK